MATAKKLKSGSWRCLVYDYTDATGKRHYRSFTSDDASNSGKRQAEYLAAEFAINKKKKIQNALTVTEALEKYINTKKDVLSPTTVRGYKGLYRTHFKNIGHINLSALTNDIIQSWIGTVSINSSPKTVRNAHALLSSTLDMFLPEFKLKTTLPQKKKPNLYIPTDEDVKRLIAYVSGKELELAIYLAAFGPMRLGEICALEDTDIKGNFVTVNKSMAMTEEYIWVIKQPKTYSSYRVIEYPDFVIEKLKPIKGRIIKATPAQISNRFRNAISYSGLTHFRFHDLRHYSASVMHAIGIPDAYIMQRGGWSSDAVLKGVYRHTMSDKLLEMNDKANDYFNEMQHKMQRKK